jgi:hypothetical protein
VAGVVAEVLEDLLAPTGWQDSVGRGLNFFSHSLGGGVDLMANAIDHVSRCMENGCHGGLVGRDAVGSKWSRQDKQWMMMGGQAGAGWWRCVKFDCLLLEMQLQ